MWFHYNQIIIYFGQSRENRLYSYLPLGVRLSWNEHVIWLWHSCRGVTQCSRECHRFLLFPNVTAEYASTQRCSSFCLQRHKRDTSLWIAIRLSRHPHNKMKTKRPITIQWPARQHSNETEREKEREMGREREREREQERKREQHPVWERDG